MLSGVERGGARVMHPMGHSLFTGAKLSIMHVQR